MPFISNIPNGLDVSWRCLPRNNVCIPVTLTAPASWRSPQPFPGHVGGSPGWSPATKHCWMHWNQHLISVQVVQHIKINFNYTNKIKQTHLYQGFIHAYKFIVSWVQIHLNFKSTPCVENTVTIYLRGHVHCSHVNFTEVGRVCDCASALKKTLRHFSNYFFQAAQGPIMSQPLATGSSNWMQSLVQSHLGHLMNLYPL